ncbi:MAG: anti-sigma factor antagonist [Clostridia bacterium]|nr:anti-sigma factor antagonist [Clostridia bacterium]
MEFKRELQKGVMTVTLGGELDEKSARETREYLDDSIKRYRFERMILDFSNVEFMDSTGIGVLLGRYNLLKSVGAELCVTGIKPQIDKVFRVSGLYQIIKAV